MPLLSPLCDFTRREMPENGSFLTGQDNGATEKWNPDIAAHFKTIRRYQVHFTFVALAGYRVVTGSVRPPVVTFGGEPIHYLQAENRAVPSCRIGIFPVDLCVAHRPIFTVYIVRLIQPTNCSADLFSALE